METNEVSQEEDDNQSSQPQQQQQQQLEEEKEEEDREEELPTISPCTLVSDSGSCFTNEYLHNWTWSNKINCIISLTINRTF